MAAATDHHDADDIPVPSATALSMASEFDTLLSWLSMIIHERLSLHFKHTEHSSDHSAELHLSDTPLAELIAQQQPSSEEMAVLLLALLPHLAPAFLHRLINDYLPEGGEFPEFGAVRASNHRGLLPTGETAQFILAGDDLSKRLEVQRLFHNEHWFARQHILWLEAVAEGEPSMSGRLVMDPELIERLTLGSVSRPRFSMEFPAEYIETAMDWDDLVLNPKTRQQVAEIEHWIQHNDTLLYHWGMQKKIKPGYRALFYGPPGNGKTLTASLLGKATGKEVYRIDLSRIISKYIGETEKNLSRLFDKAENKNWILFFDEADALFGKRTDIRDAHDRYANQEVAYLLQRIEHFPGLVILASNQRANIDEAFTRRFHALIHFPLPRAEERAQLWSRTLPAPLSLDPNIDWAQIAARYELSGANILNIVQYCAVEVLARQAACLDLALLESAILREFIKEGKVI